MAYHSNKKKKSASVKKVDKSSKNRAGENKADLDPPIRFYKKTETVDLETEKEYVCIKVPADSSAPLDKMNSTSLMFKPIRSFLCQGVLIVEHMLKLQQEVFHRNGKLGPQDVAYRISYFRRLLKSKARQEYQGMLLKARNKIIEEHFGNSEENQVDKAITDTYSEDDFHAWLTTEEVGSENENEEPDLDRDTERAVRAADKVDKVCLHYERLVMFEVGIKAWRTHNDVYDEHMRYLKNDIVKPINMSIQELLDRVEDMYLFKQFIQPPSKKGQDAGDANWKKRDEVIDGEEQRNTVFNALPNSFRQSLKDMEDDWRTFDDRKWVSILQRLEEKDQESREEVIKKAREKLKRANESEEPLKRKIPKKSRTEKTTAQGVARHCSLCKAARAPEFVYIIHNDGECRKHNNERKLSGRSAERASATKDIHKQLRKAQRRVKAREKELKMYKKYNAKIKKSKEFKKFKRKRNNRDSSSDESDSDDNQDESSSDDSSFDSD